ncbi:uncharacterized protein [Asterias amurensis]|uniref:uncharacterized protein isoform X1 n=1 Tax=Asterias amurensis TaxID=7602 RepID=UPI003AB67FCA
MAPLRWSRSDILWVMVVVGIICAGVCCEDVATDVNSILTDGISETSPEQHVQTSPSTENTTEGGLTSEFSTLPVNGTPSSETTTSENSGITKSHENKSNISEILDTTIETTTQQIGDSQVVVPGKDVPADSNTNENKPTYIKNAAGQRGQNIVAAVGSPNHHKQVRIVHVILFTSWQLIVAMIGLEVFAYCVTIFIIFGFGRRRSRAKRFGHFSWKRPGPQQLEQETSFSTVMPAREHQIGGTEEPLMRPPAPHKGMKKKPSVRGHRP